MRDIILLEEIRVIVKMKVRLLLRGTRSIGSFDYVKRIKVKLFHFVGKFIIIELPS